MNDIDKTTFERFARSFSRIERLVPDRPVAAVRPMKDRWRDSRTVGFATVAVLAAAIVGLAAIGTNTSPRPSQSAAAIQVPPDSAGPDVVLDAFLRANVAGDCETSHALKARLLADKDFVDLCGSTDVTAFTVSDGPVIVDPDEVRFSGTVTIKGMGVDLPAGVYRWTYFVQRQTNGAWRLVHGGYFAPVAPALTPGPTRPTPGELQVANPQLGGQGWTITEVDGEALQETAYLSFWGGPTGGSADGDSSSDCFFIAFDYAYDPRGTAITIFARGEGQGSGAAEGCSSAGLADYAAVTDALGRVAEWRLPQAGRIELLDDAGTVVLRGGPMPPLPTAPPVGDCGDVPVAECERAAALAFNFDLFPAVGQTVVSWTIRPSIYSSCASPGTPKYDVIFTMANPEQEWIATVVEYYGILHACGAY